MLRRLSLISVASCLWLASPLAAQAQGAPASAPVEFRLPVETFTLPNGLRVILHVDRSDPVAAVSLVAHVGSGRETPGRTGFAHLFEHLLFLDSENLGPGGLDRLSARIGGSGANGATSRDWTFYGQSAPVDALEKLLWAESEKLGFFISTVSDPVLAKEKQVVKNEKRERVDNQPYGFSNTVLVGAMYPPDHPYHWPVIGSLADLDAATLEDVRAFYRRWYTPRNTTLVVAGDIDVAQTRRWVETYFGEIAAGAAPEPSPPRPSPLSATRRLVHEDAFANLPELTLAWPGAPFAGEDAWALNVLGALLTDGKETPLTQAVVEEAKLAGEVEAEHARDKLAGSLLVTVRGFDGVDLDQVQAALDKGFARFEREGVDPAALARAKTKMEVEFYGLFSDVESKAQYLGLYDVYYDRNGGPETDLRRLRAVTADDVMRAYRRYVKDRPHVATSFVPEGKARLALERSEPAQVTVEPIVQGAEAAVSAEATAPDMAARPRTPSRIDRAIEPAAGPTPTVKAPAIWSATLADGVPVTGIVDRERPLALFQIAIDGGRLFDDPQAPGRANLLARMLTRGTAKRTTAELENALKDLGAEVEVTADRERFLITGSTLARNIGPTMDLVRDIVLEPRWDAEELALVKAAVTGEIASRRAQPNLIAARAVDHLTYGPAHPLGHDAFGTTASVAGTDMNDLKALYGRAFDAGLARVRVVGAVDQAQVTAALAGLGRGWRKGTARVPMFATPAAPTQTRVHFYDVPDAKQSVVVFAAPGPRRADPDYFAARASNFILGGGGFASRLTQQVREGKGYTYGVRSVFTGRGADGLFQVSSPVRANVTLEATTLMRDIVRDYGTTFTPADLTLTQGSLGKSRAREFESLEAKLGLLADMGDYGLPADTLAREEATLRGLTLEQVREIAAKRLRTDAMTVVIVGDAKTQASRLDALGYGPVVPLNAALDEAPPAAPSGR